MFRFRGQIREQHGRTGKHKYAATGESQGGQAAIMVDMCMPPMAHHQDMSGEEDLT